MVRPRTSNPPAEPEAAAVAETVSLQGFLAAVRAKLYRQEAARAAWRGVAALSSLGLVLPLAAHLADDSRFAITLMLVVGVLASIAVLVVVGSGVIGPRRTFAADNAIARWVGKRHPALASDLLSSVELPASAGAPWSPSPELVAVLRDTTVSRLGAIRLQSLFSSAAIVRARTWALGAIAVHVAVLALAPSTMTGGWSRLLLWPTLPFDGAELSSVPLVGDLEVTLTAPAYANRRPITLAFSSGDVRGLPGTTVAIKGRILVPATAAEIVFDPDATGQATTSIAASVDRSGQLTAEFTIDRTSRYRFATTSPTGRAIEAITRTIDAEIDRAPTVTLAAPDAPLEIANVKSVEIGYSIDDDFAVTSAELVWETGAVPGRPSDRGRKPLLPGPPQSGSSRLQGKLVWDLAEVNVASGGDVTYWIEAKDNDSVTGPNVGKSRVGHLRVVSPRARHEEALTRQQRIAEQLLANLGARLTGVGSDIAARQELSRQLSDAITELRSVATAFENDPHASDLLRSTLAAMADRIERMASAEQRVIQSATAKAQAWGGSHPGLFSAVDGKLVAELENDVLSLADWLERERVESLLDISDEIRAHHKRLADLLARYARGKQPQVHSEIEREMRALERAYGELEKHQDRMPEDVLDQYFHRNAATTEAGTSCIAEVDALVRAQKTAAAKTKLETCYQRQQRSSASLEGTLARMRGDKFSDEQNKLDEVMNTLADVAKDQDDVASESSRVYDSYTHRANELAREHRREANTKVAVLIDKSKKRIKALDDSGLTPFATEERDIVVRRIADIEHMVDDGDLAEALMMARQASASLDAMADELGAALDDDPKSKWADATQQALDGIEEARPMMGELIDELATMSPRPDQIMSSDDKRALERLRRRQGSNEQRARRLGERIVQFGSELPGDSAAELGKTLEVATDHMTKARDRMRAKDPSGARESARAAADELAKARNTARSAARQAQHSAIEEEPVRIPGAQDHHTSERFREDLLEAMKHKSKTSPEGYDVLIKRYYQDLAR